MNFITAKIYQRVIVRFDKQGEKKLAEVFKGLSREDLKAVESISIDECLNSVVLDSAEVLKINVSDIDINNEEHIKCMRGAFCELLKDLLEK